MPKIEKKINKRLIGLIIGGAIVGATAASQTPKGKKFWHKIADFRKGGFKQMKKDFSKKK